MRVSFGSAFLSGVPPYTASSTSSIPRTSPPSLPIPSLSSGLILITFFTFAPSLTFFSLFCPTTSTIVSSERPSSDFQLENDSWVFSFLFFFFIDALIALSLTPAYSCLSGSLVPSPSRSPLVFLFSPGFNLYLPS